MSVAASSAAEPPTPKPTRVGLEVLRGSGDFSADALTVLAVRLEASHEVERLRLGASLGFVRSSTEDEGETSASSALSNPTLSVHYTVVDVGGVQVGLASGLIAALDDAIDRARFSAGAFEAVRRPYEMSTESAVPVIGDVRFARDGVVVDVAAGAYFVADDGFRLDEGHLAVGAGFTLDARVSIGARVHALLTSARSASPPQYERASRAYFGVELDVTYGISEHVGVRVGLWKPFGYDDDDQGERMTALTVGIDARF